MKYYAMLNKITMEILALSLTEDQRDLKIHQIIATKGLDMLSNFEEIEVIINEAKIKRKD